MVYIYLKLCTLVLASLDGWDYILFDVLDIIWQKKVAISTAFPLSKKVDQLWRYLESLRFQINSDSTKILPSL